MRIAIGLFLAGAIASGPLIEGTQSGGLQSAGVTVEAAVSMRTRDGVVLVADVYRPAGEGRFPTLLERTPYDRRGGGQQARDLAASGYVVIKQDVRGRFDSQGEFYPFKHESEDGYDTVEWAAALPYSNGQVGISSYGSSPRSRALTRSHSRIGTSSRGPEPAAAHLL